MKIKFNDIEGKLTSLDVVFNKYNQAQHYSCNSCGDIASYLWAYTNCFGKFDKTVCSCCAEKIIQLNELTPTVKTHNG